MDDKPVLDLSPLIDAIVERMIPIIRNEITAAITPNNDDQLIDIKEVRKIFSNQVTIPTIRNWAEAGYLKKYTVGRRIFFNKREVIEASKKRA